VEKPVVAVFPFKATGVSQTTADLASDILRRELLKIGRVTVRERDEMESVLKAQGENLDDCSEEGCAIRMGQILDTEMIVVGSAVKSGIRYFVSARLIDVETSKIVSTGEVTYDDIREEQITDDMDQIAWQLGRDLKLKASIVRIDGSDIYLDAGTGLVEVGQRLQIKRQGDRISDPNTGEFLGYKESEIGELEIVQILSEKLAQCAKVSGEKMNLGDHAELSEGFQPVIPAMTPTTPNLSGTTPVRPSERKSYGSIAINSSPQGASVILDGDDLGVTPLTKSGIESGDHTLLIHKDGYVDNVQGITIPVGRSLPVTAKLVMMSGNLLIKSDPVGAWITFDGKARGEATRSGLSLKMLKVGRYKVKAELDHYYPTEQTVEVDFNLTKPITLTLKPKPGSIYASSTPPGAEIIIDGKASGVKTPGKVTDVEAKDHTVVLRLSGYRDKSVKVTVAPDKTKMLSETLNKVVALKNTIGLQMGSLRIITYPIGARIYINGNLKGVSPLTIDNLSEQEYQVSATWSNGLTVGKRVEVLNGEIVDLYLKAPQKQKEDSEINLSDMLEVLWKLLAIVSVYYIYFKQMGG